MRCNTERAASRPHATALGMILAVLGATERFRTEAATAREKDQDDAGTLHRDHDE